MRRLLAPLLLVLVAAAGCSQVDALAPVGGGREALVRFAGNDVLVTKGVAIRTAPVCRYDAGAVTCEGSTLDGLPIRVTAPPGDPARMTVTVGSRTLYDGGVQEIVDASGRPS